MRVLMFGWEFPPYISGGLGTACYGLTRALSNLGILITFVIPKALRGEKTGYLNMLGLDDIERKLTEENLYYDEGLLKFVKVDSLLQPYLTSQAYEKNFQKAQQRITELLEKTQGIFHITGNYGPNLMSEVSRYALIGKFLGQTEKFDIIHVHDWMTFLAGVEAKLISNKPLVVHVHATEFDRSGENVNQEIYDIERYGMHMADKVIAVSFRTKDIIVSRYGVNPDKVEVVHNAIIKEKTIEKSQSYKTVNEKIVLFLGRITFQKGPFYFLQAAKKVIDRIQNVRFVMAGSGDLLPQVIEKMAELKLLEHFHFTGFLSGEKKEKIYAMSDLFVMPSVSEPFGLTPMEAILYGVPVIVSKQSGVAEVLKNVITVDFWDVDKLAEKMIEVLTNEELAKKKVLNAQQELEEIDWNNAAQKISELYKVLYV